MTPHIIFDDWGHGQVYTVMAVNFAQRRMVVRCGDGSIGYTQVGFELKATTTGRIAWHRFDPRVNPNTGYSMSPSEAARVGGRSLGECLDYDTWLVKPTGPGLGPLLDWLRDEVGRATERAKAARGGERWSTWAPHVAVEVTCLQSLAAPVGDWLLDIRRRGTAHGNELREMFDKHGYGPCDAARVDGIIHPLMACGLVRPVEYCPVPGTYVGETCGLRQPAKSGPMKGKVPATYDGDPLTDKLFGSHLWRFQAGSRLREIPHFSV